MKKRWTELFLMGIFIFIIIPLFIAFILSFRFICTDTSNEWIGFWGSYLGSVLGGLITLFVLYQTLKENRLSQLRREKIDFCNYISELVGKLCRKINEKDIYILRYVELEKEVGGNKKDVYNALLVQNEAFEILQILTSQLISKIGNTEYKQTEELMDKIDELCASAVNYELKFNYNKDEIKDLQNKSDITRKILGEIRDDVVKFIKMNCN